jgi:prenylcysteine oxidase / farnesylcysteine lyase
LIFTGSTVVYPYGNTSLQRVELGAMIFVEVNRNMMRAAKEFNLHLIGLANEADNEMGIWDGNQFVLMVRCILDYTLACY